MLGLAVRKDTAPGRSPVPEEAGGREDQKRKMHEDIGDHREDIPDEMLDVQRRRSMPLPSPGPCTGR